MNKQVIRNIIDNGFRRSYKKREQNLITEYDTWIRAKEKEMPVFEAFSDAVLWDGGSDSCKDVTTTALRNNIWSISYKDASFCIIPYSLIDADFSLSFVKEEYIVFTGGDLSRISIPKLQSVFSNNSKTAVVYGNEDRCTKLWNENAKYGTPEDKDRSDPDFKPQWSPNTFLSHFYFGNLVAIRKSAFKGYDADCESAKGALRLYEMLLRFFSKGPENMFGRVAFADEVLVHVKDYIPNGLVCDKSYELMGRLWDKNLPGINEKAGISVIIPSKDNPEMLRKCISSVKNVDNYKNNIEIIVVDNGSNTKNKSIIENMSLDFGFKYSFYKADFNFSEMCNKGAALATGDYLLFLNDDVEIVGRDCLSKMVRESGFVFSGAVGIKLLYPQSRLIQHAGIVNNRIGPIHKLQFLDDDNDYGHGFNRFSRNVLAVTGAALMIRKHIFTECGGFNEELWVAFNDVDFCFRLHEKKYYNTVVNDTYMIHHESVSRGNDSTKDSLKRLMREKDYLYDAHPALRGYDPFYSGRLSNDVLDSRIVPASEFEADNYLQRHPVFKPLGPCEINAKCDECVVTSLEYVGRLGGYTYESRDNEKLLVEGFAYVSGSDNAVYNKYLILAGTAESYLADLSSEEYPVYRSDLKENCPNEENISLGGIVAVIDTHDLPKGEYRIGVLMKKKMSDFAVYKMSERYILVD